MCGWKRSSWAASASVAAAAELSPSHPAFRPTFERSGRRRDIDEPGHSSSLDQIFEHFLVLQRVHRPPEAVMPEGEQLIVLDQTLEGFFDQLFAVTQIVENLSAKDEAAAVDPEIDVLGCPDGGSPCRRRSCRRDAD